MPTPTPSFEPSPVLAPVSLSGRWRVASMLAMLLLCPPLVQAERADRSKPLTVAADQQGTIDIQKQVVVFTGNVVITKGTLVIRSHRVEVRELPDGFRTAVATAGAGKPASFRQKRDGVDEYIDGEADRLEYEERSDTVRFVGNAKVRRLRGSAVADEITGNLVTYDSLNEVFSVSGSPRAAGGATNPAVGSDGRVRAILSPREGSEAARAATEAPPPPASSPLRLSPLPPSTAASAGGAR